MDGKEGVMPDDPWKDPEDEERTTFVEVCYAEGCTKVHGCLVTIGKRAVVFRDSCGECDRHDKPDCFARCTAKLTEIPLMCTSCATKGS